MLNYNETPHNFLFISKKSFKPSTHGLEIRVKDNHGVWQNWQLISNDFYITKLSEQNDEILVPVEDYINDLNENFEIRYCGIIHASHFGEISIISNDNILTHNPYTGRIEYKMDFSNHCYPFEDQLMDLMKFKNKYYQYDNNGNRI